MQGISRRKHGGQIVPYFILVPQSDPSVTILLPVESADKIGVRKIITPEEANRIMVFLSEAEADWVSDVKKRKQEYESTLKSADLFALARMIKELLIHEKIAVLSNFDKEILPKAQKRLFSEIALANGDCYEDTLHAANRLIQS